MVSAQQIAYRMPSLDGQGNTRRAGDECILEGDLAMFLKFEVFDSNQKAVGNTSVSFDWKAHMWAVNEDKAGAWKRIAAVRSGKFEVKDWGVMWMWDKARNIRTA